MGAEASKREIPVRDSVSSRASGKSSNLLSSCYVSATVLGAAAVSCLSQAVSKNLAFSLNPTPGQGLGHWDGS